MIARGRPSLTEALARNKRYTRHRQALKRIHSLVDMKPKPIVAPSALFLAKMKQDALAFRRINNKNKDILQKILLIQSNTSLGNVSAHIKPRTSTTRMNVARRHLNDIERRNISLGCKLLTVKSSLNTRKGLAAYTEELRRRETFEIPEEILEKYSSIVLPVEVDLLEQLLRPKIYFDLEVQNIRPLGRIVVQLFTEACPEVVLEFVRMCQSNNLEAFQFIRVFSTLWIEGELLFETPTLKDPGFEYDMHIVDHAYGPGIFSFAKCYLAGFPNGLINFSISFKPLSVLNGERLPFGLVTRGLRVIDCLEDFGTKNGKAKKQIIASRCGMFR